MTDPITPVTRRLLQLSFPGVRSTQQAPTILSKDADSSYARLRALAEGLHGKYGAERVERAFEGDAHLGDVFAYSALRDALIPDLSQSRQMRDFSRTTPEPMSGALSLIDPKDFELYARRQPPDYVADRATIKNKRNMAGEKVSNYEQIREALNAGVADEVPFLVTRGNHVFGHEGRGREYVRGNYLGHDSSLIRILPYEADDIRIARGRDLSSNSLEEFIQDIRKTLGAEMTSEERVPRKSLEIFAGGGQVDARLASLAARLMR